MPDHAAIAVAEVSGWIAPLIGALATAVVGSLTLIVRRVLYGKSEDEALATKAAQQAVEVVDDVLKALRTQREDDHREITELKRTREADREQIAECQRRIDELEAEVRDLKTRVVPTPRAPE